MVHHREDRIRGHVQLCWPALLRIRVAENATEMGGFGPLGEECPPCRSTLPRPRLPRGPPGRAGRTTFGATDDRPIVSHHLDRGVVQSAVIARMQAGMPPTKVETSGAPSQATTQRPTPRAGLSTDEPCCPPSDRPRASGFDLPDSGSPTERQAPRTSLTHLCADIKT